MEAHAQEQQSKRSAGLQSAGGRRLQPRHHDLVHNRAKREVWSMGTQFFVYMLGDFDRENTPRVAKQVIQNALQTVQIRAVHEILPEPLGLGKMRQEILEIRQIAKPHDEFFVEEVCCAMQDHVRRAQDSDALVAQ